MIAKAANYSNAPSGQNKTIRVLVPVPVGNGYDYLVPEDITKLEEGSFVSVPLGKKEAIGIVWSEGDGDVPLSKLKSLYGVLEVPPLNAATRKFLSWCAGYTLTPPGAILKMVLGGRYRALKTRDKLDLPLPDPDAGRKELSESQSEAAQNLVKAVKDEKFSVTLLDGVTGSGKTEVYAEAIAEALRNGQQALLLLPEIAMTAALTDRLTKRFGIAPTLWHSSITEKQKRLNWHTIAQGKARFIVGARSALFLPYPALGVIVVDEEHEAAYKQEDGVIYHGRDMAVARAHHEKIPAILASATPSLETVHNVNQGKYRHVILKSRFGGATLPEIKSVDLRQEKMDAQTFISDPLFEALKTAKENGQQSMLFLNRRGYAPLTLCRACGHRLQCPSCTSWLIEHRRTGRLHCHHCDYSIKTPKICPVCGAEDKFAACGPGIERVAEEIEARMPDMRFAIMASDTLTSPKVAEELVQKMNEHELDLLIGTQIMAKGYHFPRLTVVGVIDADLGLAGGDPRAAERTFQLLQQVAGRSGRAEERGTVFLQTTAPDHPVMKALIEGDRDAFMEAELRERKAYRLPPFGRLASITIAGKNEREVITISNEIARAAPQIKDLRILGPAPAPFAILRGMKRYRLMVQSAQSNAALARTIQNWIAPIKIPRSIRLHIDIDPYSFL